MTKKNKYRNSSRRKTPWDDKPELSPLEEFIKSNYLDFYYDKHPPLRETNEAELINSFKVETCRNCGSNQIEKRGLTKNGIQRYYCRDCKKSFNVLTNTIFDDHKISLIEWIEYMLDLFRYESINVTSKSNKNSFNTSEYWLLKIFMTISDIQDDIVLSGNVYIDETFIPMIEKDIITKDGKKLRGLSKNQYCIGVGYDGTNVIALVEGTGKPSRQKTLDTFKNHIKPGSHLIHDKEKSHNILVQNLNLTSEAYNSKEVKKLPDKDNPLYPINLQCSLLKKFLYSHSGFNREHLQDYLNLYCLISNPPIDKLLKVKLVINRAMCNPKKLTYREAFSKKI